MGFYYLVEHHFIARSEYRTVTPSSREGESRWIGFHRDIPDHSRTEVPMRDDWIL
jgi:hypothetical protein